MRLGERVKRKLAEIEGPGFSASRVLAAMAAGKMGADPFPAGASDQLAAELDRELREAGWSPGPVPQVRARPLRGRRLGALAAACGDSD